MIRIRSNLKERKKERKKENIANMYSFVPRTGNYKKKTKNEPVTGNELLKSTD